MDLSKAQKTKIGKLNKEELQLELNEDEPCRFGQGSRWYIQKRLDEFLHEEERVETDRQQVLREKELSTAESALSASKEARESSQTANLLSEKANSISKQANLKSWIAIGISAIALLLATVSFLE